MMNPFFKRQKVICPQLLSMHIQQCRQKIPPRFHFKDDTGILRRIEYLSGHLPFFEMLFLKQGSLFQTMASEFMGKPMYLFKDKITFKNSNRQRILPHTEDAYHQSTHVAGMLAVDPCHAKNGQLQLLLPPKNSDETMTSLGMGLDKEKTEEEIQHLKKRGWAWKGMNLESGEVLWFNGRTYHQSMENLSSSGRTVILLNYSDNPYDTYHEYFQNSSYREKIAKNVKITEEFIFSDERIPKIPQ